ncbi:MAG TPA: CsgG/HfaB family protein [Bryobacteraceae bacterium]|jgi:curli biogenesis system outer membrane secretion channel CsgG|nr:CsgG/HfaB family protein [Bryobacteraceae bacterium]
MRRTVAPIFAVLLLSGTIFGQSPKKRVAILDFDFATVQGNIAAIFGTNQDVGKGISDLLVDRLVTDGRFSVVERTAIAKVLAEQNLSNSDRADASTAAKLGKILGVQYIIIGSITQFGRDDQSHSLGGGGYSGFGSKYGLGNLGTHKAKAVVAVNARMIDTNTAEILAVASGKGESTRSGANLLGGGGANGGGGSGGMSMNSSNFGTTILGEAVSAAVTELATGLENNNSKLPTQVVSVSGMVADVSGNALVINVGSKAGLKAGDHLTITRPVRKITDPATGKVLRSVEEPVGTLTVTDVDESSASGAFSGSGAPKVGDTVKNQ